MVEVSFTWVNGGEPFELPGIPIRGHRELNDARKRSAKVQAELSRALLANACNIMLATKALLDDSGPEAAKRFWDYQAPSMVGFPSGETIAWPVEEFATRFNGWYEKKALRALDAEDFADAKEKVRELTESIDQELVGEWESVAMEHFLLEIYWRLRGTFKTIIHGKDELPLTMDNLAEVVVFPEDRNSLISASTKGKPVDHDKFMEVDTEESVKKKSRRKRKPSTKSSRGSEPSSEDSTVANPT